MTNLLLSTHAPRSNMSVTVVRGFSVSAYDQVRASGWAQYNAPERCRDDARLHTVGLGRKYQQILRHRVGEWLREAGKQDSRVGVLSREPHGAVGWQDRLADVDRTPTLAGSAKPRPFRSRCNGCGETIPFCPRGITIATRKCLAEFT